ncbi:hypothetical protein GOP47_0024794, partial [Adiantum capillus-veneris]
RERDTERERHRERERKMRASVPEEARGWVRLGRLQERERLHLLALTTLETGVVHHLQRLRCDMLEHLAVHQVPPSSSPSTSDDAKIRAAFNLVDIQCSLHDFMGKEHTIADYLSRLETCENPTCVNDDFPDADIFEAHNP